VLLSKIEELIDLTTRTWDTQLVREIFWEEDVPDILAIPVQLGRDDVIAWHHDSKGMFSVKSTYHVLADEEKRQQ